MMIADQDIGGARVRRVFTRVGKPVKGGDMLTGDEVRAIPIANRRALIDAGYIEVWPKSSDAATTAELVTLKAKIAERHIVHRGQGKYDVFAAKINDEPLSKEDAEDLATRPN